MKTVGALVAASAVLGMCQCASSWDEYSPKYRLIFDSDNTTAPEVATALASTGTFDNHSFELLRYNGYEYLCDLPAPEVAPDVAAAEDAGGASAGAGADAAARNRHDREQKQLVTDKIRGVQERLAAAGVCIVHSSNYWAYQYCFNGNFVQYHYLVDGRVKDPDSPVYRLGRVPQSIQDGDLEIVRDELADADGASYVSQLIGEGSVCDLTGKPRSAFVKYKCGKGLPAPQIQSVSELKSCQYQVTIRVPELCDLDVFRSKEQALYDVSCRAVARDGAVTPARINVNSFQLALLGHGIFLAVVPPRAPARAAAAAAAAPAAAAQAVFVTNRRDFHDTDALRKGLFQALFGAVRDAAIPVPRYIVDHLQATGALDDTGKKNLLVNDTFTFVGKLYNLNGEFLDNFQLEYDPEGSVLTFGLENLVAQDGPDALPDREWYGTSVAPDEVPAGNIIAYNRVRFQGKLASSGR